MMLSNRSLSMYGTMGAFWHVRLPAICACFERSRLTTRRTVLADALSILRMRMKCGLNPLVIWQISTVYTDHETGRLHHTQPQQAVRAQNSQRLDSVLHSPTKYLTSLRYRSSTY
jgi:hypothetical protein